MIIYVFYVLVIINYNDITLIQNLFFHIQLNQMKFGFQIFWNNWFQLLFIDMKIKQNCEN